MDTSILGEIGLTKGEISVYLSLLGLGSSTVGPIVDKAKVSYSKIYDILERLVDKGLVCYVIRENRKYFEAAPVGRIMEYMDERQKEIGEQKEKLEALLPSLKARQQAAGYAAESVIYRGLKGLETAFMSSLILMGKADELLVIDGMSGPDAARPFFHRFLREVDKRGLKVRAIVNERRKEDHVAWPDARYTQNVSPATIAIFKDRVIILPSSKDIVLFVIDCKEVAGSFRAQFESWWDQRVKTYQGVEQIRRLWMEKLEYGDYCGLGEGTKIVKVLGEDFFVKWQEEKRRRGVNGRVLIGEAFRDSVTVRKSIANFRFISGYENPGVTEIFKDKVLVVNFSAEPVAFMIEDKKIAQSHQTYFDLLWKSAVP